MTDRERFEANAVAHGVTVLRSEPTVFEYKSTNGKLITTCTFTNEGKFKEMKSTWV